MDVPPASADALITDPPYNVNYEGKTKDRLTIDNDNMEDDAFEDFLIAAFQNADEVMCEGAAFYIWHADGNNQGRNFRNACHEIGWEIRQCLIWVKNQFVLGRQDYQWKHEPCLYGWKKGQGHYFIYDRTQTTVFETKIDFDIISHDEAIKLLKIIYSDEMQGTIIREDKPQRNDIHPTMKPIGLMSRLIMNSTQKGDVVLDLFGGSGTTLIACEQLNRRCYMMEYDPIYIDAIIQRWEDFTGRKAVLINGKEDTD